MAHSRGVLPGEARVAGDVGVFSGIREVALISVEYVFSACCGSVILYKVFRQDIQHRVTHTTAWFVAGVPKQPTP